MTAEDDNKIIEAMARAMCVADGYEPDVFTLYFQGNVNTGMSVPGWQNYEKAARRQYFAHKAMMEALGEKQHEYCIRSVRADGTVSSAPEKLPPHLEAYYRSRLETKLFAEEEKQ